MSRPNLTIPPEERERRAEIIRRAWETKRRRYGPNGSPLTNAQRLFKYIEFDLIGGCWLWFGAIAGSYGAIQSSEGKYEIAHRLSWKTYRGPIPDGMFVLHKCDTPFCVNPDHLFLGDGSDNMRDMTAKGRRSGPAVYKRLTPEQDYRIVDMYSHGDSKNQIAKAMGIERATVTRALRRASSRSTDLAELKERYNAS